MNIKIKLIVFSLAGVLSQGIARAGDTGSKAPSPDQHVLREIQDAAKRLESYFTRIEGSGTLMRYRKPIKLDSNRKPVLDSEGRAIVDPDAEEEMQRALVVDFWINDHLRKFVERRDTTAPRPPRPGGRSRELIRCVGPSYYFSLDRDLRGGGIQLKAFGRNDAMEETINSTYSQFSECPFNIGGIRLTQLIGDPAFSLGRVEKLDDGKVKVYYKFNSKDIIYRGGWIVLSPERQWPIQSYSIDAEMVPGRIQRAFVTGIVEYEDSDDGFALPTRATCTLRGAIRDVFTFNSIRHTIVPEREFTLPAYGLPDIDAPPRAKGGSSTSSWFYLAAVASLLMALFLAWMGRRASARIHP